MSWVSTIVSKYPMNTHYNLIINDQRQLHNPQHIFQCNNMQPVSRFFLLGPPLTMVVFLNITSPYDQFFTPQSHAKCYNFNRFRKTPDTERSWDHENRTFD
jgi:hypothetical protein